MDADRYSRRFLDPGPLLPWIDQFAAELAARRYTQLTIDGYTASARHFGVWLESAGILINDVDDAVVLRFFGHRCRCPGGRRWQHVSPKYARRAGKFVAFLQKMGVTPPPLTAIVAYPLLDDYQRWLRVHRGLSERTVARHLRILHKLLPDLGTASSGYDAARIRNVVRKWREQTGPADMRTMTSALRSYLRFLAGTGLCRPDLDHAIPPVVQWRLSSLPR